MFKILNLSGTVNERVFFHAVHVYCMLTMYRLSSGVSVMQTVINSIYNFLAENVLGSNFKLIIHECCE